MPRARVVVALVAAALLSACTARYFREAGAPPTPAPRYALERWPYAEYWTGIVFNGAKIGFSRNALAAEAGAADRYVLRSESAFRLRFLGYDKRIELRTRDVVGSDLTLARFEHSHDLDGHTQRVAGEVANGRLAVVIETAGETSRQEHALAEPLYPTAALALYPVLHGLEVGRRYQYLVYDAQLQRLARATQEVVAYETSPLFAGPAFRVVTHVHGYKTTTWIDAAGRPLLERALHGVVFSALEPEEKARRYLALASVNKHDALLDYSRVRTNVRLARPREARLLGFRVEGVGADFVLPTDARQECAKVGAAWRCRIRRLEPAAPGAATTSAYLQPSTAVQSEHPRFRALARELTANTTDRRVQIERLLAWIERNIERRPIDVFSALDVLNGRKAECQGHALVYTALARAAGIPTRVVNGLVYSEEHEGFLYHSWTESNIGDQWLAVDPIFGQLSADATHIKLLEGETAADLLPLIDVVGRLQIAVDAYE